MGYYSKRLTQNLPYRGAIRGLGKIGNTALIYYYNYLYASYDYGNTWSFKADSSPSISSNTISVGNKLFVCGAPADGISGSGRVFLSNDSGLHWKSIYNSQGLDNGIHAICSMNKLLIACIEGQGVLVSKDNGNSWYFVNEGLNDLIIYDISADSFFMYVGAEKGRVFRRSLSEITGVNKIASNSNELFQLKVYPNPSKIYTNFEFGRILKNGAIILYDMTGKEINSIKNINATQYVMQNNLSKGVYLYYITEGDKN